jgi:tRNA nucleotidyltransferase (CCA-adding enzyme)
MSDYMFMLDSHLNSEQSKVLAHVRNHATAVSLNLFLTGGAMRDMLGGFPIRDLDFTVEGNAVRFAKSVAAEAGAEILHVDETKKSVELRFPGRVTAEIAMARQERYPRPGAKPVIQPSTIHEDLRCRDFTVNSIGLSLSRASYGLLLDPANGLADIERKELQAVTNYGLYDDPSRLLRLLRLKARLGYQIAERTQSQYRNVREAQLETKIPPAALEKELRQIASDPAALEILQLFDQEKLLTLFAPDFTTSKMNVTGLQKLHKARQLMPFGEDLRVDDFTLFVNVFVEKLNPKERSQLLATTGIEKRQLEAASKLEASAKKRERTLSSAKLQRPSALYSTLVKVPGEEILFLLMRSNQRIVVDRLRNYLQKYLPAAQEITDAVVEEHGGKPGTPKYAKIKSELIATRLDSRPRKVVPVEAPPPPPPISAPARRQSTWGR